MASKEKLTLKKHSNTKTRFTRRFLASLLRMRRANNNSNTRVGYASSHEEIRRRSHRIKIASYSSMARAVGSRRVWSRALLLKLRNRAKLQGILRNKCFALKKKRKLMVKSKVPGEMSKADTLRTLVPGGETMDFCKLLEETASYMKCLATQVKVMQSIVDRYPK
ncbi:transcription factor, putative [Ricinus communis]|uniref:Transcription factor, putative n=2 Tax=Ricinus communis TaxID=3988 RepID=B9TBR8_RICCO|nr:transcription factor, putative [Ricinus communis]